MCRPRSRCLVVKGLGKGGKEMKEIRTEINKIENQKTMQRIIKTRIFFKDQHVIV